MYNYNDIEIVYETKNVIVVNKPNDIPVQRDKQGSNNIIDIIKTKYKDAELINRLDTNVSGLVLIGKNKNTVKALNEQMQQSTIQKKYRAVVCGVAKDRDVLEDYLFKNQRTNVSKVVNKNSSNSKLAILSYENLKTVTVDNKVYSLVDISLKTGRHHQIRVQMANQGLPLYADNKYGKGVGHGNIGLQSYYMKFVDNGVVEVVIDMPKEIPFEFF